MLDTFYRDGSKFSVFALMYVPLFIGLCDNAITRTILIGSFLTTVVLISTRAENGCTVSD